MPIFSALPNKPLKLPLANRGETPTGKRSEEAPTAMHENERSGTRSSTSRVSPGQPRNLNFSNRPVRTRMPGGVAGVPGVMIRAPMPIKAFDRPGTWCGVRTWKGDNYFAKARSAGRILV
jgi:hypothetical protein